MFKVAVSSLLSRNGPFAGEIKMKNVRGFALGLVLGLGVALGGLAFAQNTSDQNKKAESCCAMANCCCGDSCAMKDGANAKSDKH
jgi:hypothetical protein